jgi:23S rRNA pseudoU1915 N3-methylase RlmH
MTDKQQKLITKEVENILAPLSKTERLIIIEKLGKKWRRENSAEIYEAEARDRLKMAGKRIKDVDTVKHIGE